MKKIFKALLIILFYFLYNYLIILLPFVLLGIDYNTAPIFMKLLYVIAANLFFFGNLLLIYNKTLSIDFEDFKHNSKEYLSFGFKWWFVGVSIMIASNLIILFLTPGGISENEQAVRDQISTLPIYMAFLTILYAPLVEELIFRKTLKDIFKNKYLFIFFSALIFGGLHVMKDTMFWYDYLHLIPYCSLGFAFAYMYEKTNNIFTSISIHLFHNSLSIILFVISLIIGV